MLVCDDLGSSVPVTHLFPYTLSCTHQKDVFSRPPQPVVGRNYSNVLNSHFPHNLSTIFRPPRFLNSINFLNFIR